AGAGYADASLVWLGWTAAALAVITAYVRTLGAAMGAGQHFVGQMQKTHRMAVMAVACVAGVMVSLFGGSVVPVLRFALLVIGVGCLITIVVRCRQIIRV